MQSFNRQQLIERLTEDFSNYEDYPPECVVILACIRALDGGAGEQFYLMNEDEETVPEWINGFARTSVAQWDGSYLGSLGYGSVERFQTSHGAGLVFSLGGSALAGAQSAYVLPAKLGWILGV